MSLDLCKQDVRRIETLKESLHIIIIILTFTPSSIGISCREIIWFHQRNLKDNLVELGEVDHAMDEVIGFMQEVESELHGLDDIYGDPRHIETYLKKIQVWNNNDYNNNNNSNKDNHNNNHNKKYW